MPTTRRACSATLSRSWSSRRARTGCSKVWPVRRGCQGVRRRGVWRCGASRARPSGSVPACPGRAGRSERPRCLIAQKRERPYRYVTARTSEIGLRGSSRQQIGAPALTLTGERESSGSVAVPFPNGRRTRPAERGSISWFAVNTDGRVWLAPSLPRISRSLASCCACL